MRWRRLLLWLGFRADLADGRHYVAPGPYLTMGPAMPDETPYLVPPEKVADYGRQAMDAIKASGIRAADIVALQFPDPDPVSGIDLSLPLFSCARPELNKGDRVTVVVGEDRHLFVVRDVRQDEDGMDRYDMVRDTDDEDDVYDWKVDGL